MNEFKADTEDVKSCSNCGDEFIQGEGFPENEWECCCDQLCWIELTDQRFIEKEGEHATSISRKNA